tara:strand:- start:3081 stop:3470 length:390 start_codon:yes stop_codon:yes gene_type:complete
MVFKIGLRNPNFEFGILRVRFLAGKQKVMDLLKGDCVRVLNSFFFKRGKDIEYVREGSQFRHVRRDGLIETARILSVATDLHGIPHVRFQVSFDRPDQNQVDGGARMLALKAFADRYRERVSKAEPMGH